MSKVRERVRDLMAGQAAENRADAIPEGDKLTIVIISAKDGWHIRFGDYDYKFGPEPYQVMEGTAMRAMRRFRDNGKVHFD